MDIELATHANANGQNGVSVKKAEYITPLSNGNNISPTKTIKDPENSAGTGNGTATVKNEAPVITHGHNAVKVNSAYIDSDKNVNNVAHDNHVKSDANHGNNITDVNNMSASNNVNHGNNVAKLTYEQNVGYVNSAADVNDDVVNANNTGVAVRHNDDFDITDINDFANKTAQDRSDNGSTMSQRARRSTLQLTRSLMLDVQVDKDHPPTSYFETLVHLFKGNIGPGLFAMGDAFKNGGLIVAPILTVAIAVISIHCQHVLINCSNRMREFTGAERNSDYAETVGQCFENGPENYQSWSKTMRKIVNIFIVVTQLGFCCIYFVFISSNASLILRNYGIHIDVHLLMLMAFVPILLASLITNLKWLTPVSFIANICMILGLIITFYFAVNQGLPDVGKRALYTNPPQTALFFGTAIFAFEGIALVLPLKNAMSEPNDFERPFGVLNVGMFIVTSMFLFAGFAGYMKWGEEVGGSLTYNLGDSTLAQVVKGMVSMGVMFGYPLQFFIAIQIMWPKLKICLECFHRPLAGELLFRTVMVMVTLAIAEIVPALGLFISLVGSLCSTALALVFPPIIELLVLTDKGEKPGFYIYSKNAFIILLALLGFSTGTYESMKQIIERFGQTDV